MVHICLLAHGCQNKPSEVTRVTERQHESAKRREMRRESEGYIGHIGQVTSNQSLRQREVSPQPCSTGHQRLTKSPFPHLYLLPLLLPPLSTLSQGEEYKLTRVTEGS